MATRKEGASMDQQQRQIHISDFCERVYKHHERECRTPPGASETTTGAARRNYFGDEPQTASKFDDEAAEAEWSNKWGTQTPLSHVDSIAPDDDVYEGIDQKPRAIDALPAYLAKQSGISYESAVEYTYRARFGCHWGGKKRVSGEVWPDISGAAGTVSAYFQGDAMRELIAWFLREYPHEAAKMGLELPMPTDTGVSASIGDPVGERPASKGMSWKNAKGAAERHVKRHDNVFPGVKALARIVGCAPSTMLKAIENSTYLTARKAEHKQAAKNPKEVALTTAILETTPLQPETEPREVALARLTQEQADECMREERQRTKRRHTHTPPD